MIETAAVVLAAGGSTRLGRPKQLLEYRGEPLVRHAVRVALGARCKRTLVIWGATPISQALDGLPIELVENDAWQEGIASSIRVATERAQGLRILFTLSDQPLVTSGHLTALVAQDASVVATAYGDVIGVPAVFAPELRPELLALRGDEGARRILEAHRNSLRVLRLDAASVDIDHADDLSQLGSPGDP